MDTREIAEEYLGECQLRGLASATIRQYRWALNRLVVGCSNLPCSTREVLAVVGCGSLSAESRKDLLRCLKGFFAWCSQNYGIANPCEGVKAVTVKKRVPRVLSAEELARLMEVSVSDRDKALLLLILDCGLRVGEVASLRRHNLVDGWVVVEGKTGARRVPVSAELEKLLQVIGDGDCLWLGRLGPMTKAGVIFSYERLFDAAGVVGPKSGPHTLRHTFATMYLRGGGSVRQLQQILGHQSVETTMIYVHLAGLDVKEDHGKFSPARTLGLLDLVKVSE